MNKLKPLSPRKKKFLIILLSLIVACTIIAIILVIPFKDKSILNIWVAKFSDYKKYDSTDVFQLISSILPWVLILWGFTNRILESHIIKQKRKKYVLKNQDLITLYEDVNINELKKTFTKQEEYAQTVLDLIIDACIKDNIQLKGVAPHQIREVLLIPELKRKDKQLAIKKIFEDNGINLAEYKLVDKLVKSI